MAGAIDVFILPVSTRIQLIPSEIDASLLRCSYAETHKCAIMEVPRLVLFRNLLI
jgi:hypothetical protein